MCTLTRIETDAPKIQKKLSEASVNGNLKAFGDQKRLIVDQRMLNFVKFCQQIKRPVTLNLLFIRAVRSEKGILKLEDLFERKELNTLSERKCCCLAFIKCHALPSVSLHGEAGSVNAPVTVTKIGFLRKN